MRQDRSEDRAAIICEWVFLQFILGIYQTDLSDLSKQSPMSKQQHSWKQFVFWHEIVRNSWEEEEEMCWFHCYIKEGHWDIQYIVTV